jgi:ectoine hydroxylase-related dioxygenase (phytanoyl-CoA dioxygenase family)
LSLSRSNGYFAVQPSPYLTLWLAINEATVQNGCIWVLPGSHRKGLLPHVQTPIGLSCHSLEDTDQGVPVPLRAGSIAAFPSLMVHKSGVNRTAGWRRAFVIQYSKAGTRAALTGELLPDKIPVARNGLPV